MDCDEEECLHEVVNITAGRLRLPAGVTAVETESSERTCRAACASTVEIILDHFVAQWAVRHAEWIQNFFCKE